MLIPHLLNVGSVTGQLWNECNCFNCHTSDE